MAVGNPDIIQLGGLYGGLADFGGDSESQPANAESALPVAAGAAGFVVGLIAGVAAAIAFIKR